MTRALDALDALRRAYPNAEAWMLEGVACALDAQRGNDDAVRETIESFLGPLARAQLDALVRVWSDDDASVDAGEARERSGASTSAPVEGGGGNGGGRRARALRGPRVTGSRLRGRSRCRPRLARH